MLIFLKKQMDHEDIGETILQKKSYPIWKKLATEYQNVQKNNDDVCEKLKQIKTEIETIKYKKRKRDLENGDTTTAEDMLYPFWNDALLLESFLEDIKNKKFENNQTMVNILDNQENNYYKDTTTVGIDSKNG